MFIAPCPRELPQSKSREVLQLPLEPAAPLRGSCEGGSATTVLGFTLALSRPNAMENGLSCLYRIFCHL